MVVLWSWSSEIIGVTSDGFKIVNTTVYAGFGDKKTIDVSPIRYITGFFPGITTQAYSGASFSFSNFGDNLIYVIASDDSEGAEFHIISFCV